MIWQTFLAKPRSCDFILKFGITDKGNYTPLRNHVLINNVFRDPQFCQ